MTMYSTRSTVLHLHDFSCPPCYGKQVTGSSKYELVNLAGSLLHRTNQRIDTNIYGSCCDRVQVSNVLQGKGYTLRVNYRKEPLKSKHPLRVRLLNPEPSLKLLDESVFQSVRDEKIHPVFLVEESETNSIPNGLELNLTIRKKNNFTLKYLILQQDISTMEWSDITNMCTTGKDICPEISIPIQKSAKIWVIHLNRFLCSHVPSLLALLNGQITAHILLYYKVVNKKMKVRIIGISEELNQNGKRSKTAVAIAEEEGFIKGGESGPVWLSWKEGNLNAEFYKDGNCFKSSEFGIGKNNTHKYIDCTFDVKDLNDNMDVKVIDNNGHVQWFIDLNEMFYLEQHGNELQSVDDLKQAKQQIPWIEPHVNTQYEEKADCRLELKRLKSSHAQLNVDTANSFKRCTLL